MKPLTDNEMKFIKMYCGRHSSRWMGKRLRRDPRRILAYIREIGRECGVPVGHVKLRDVFDKNTARVASVAAKSAGVLHQGEWSRAPYTVPEAWLEKYLDRRLSRAGAEATASREGWLGVGELAAAIGMPWRDLSAALVPSKRHTGLGRCFAGVPRIEGPRAAYYYEPQAAAEAVGRAKRWLAEAPKYGSAVGAAMELCPAKGIRIDDTELMRAIIERSGRKYSLAVARDLMITLDRSPYFEKHIAMKGKQRIRVFYLKDWMAKAA